VNGYPDDPRLHLPATHVWVRRISGRPFLFVSDMTGEFLHVYRFSPQADGEIAIPCALFAKKHIQRKDGYPAHQPEKGQWLWRDRNANGAIDADEYQGDGGKDGRGTGVARHVGSQRQRSNGRVRYTCVTSTGSLNRAEPALTCDVCNGSVAAPAKLSPSLSLPRDGASPEPVVWPGSARTSSPCTRCHCCGRDLD